MHSRRTRRLARRSSRPATSTARFESCSAGIKLAPDSPACTSSLGPRLSARRPAGGRDAGARRSSRDSIGWRGPHGAAHSRSAASSDEHVNGRNSPAPRMIRSITQLARAVSPAGFVSSPHPRGSHGSLRGEFGRRLGGGAMPHTPPAQRARRHGERGRHRRAGGCRRPRQARTAGPRPEAVRIRDSRGRRPQPLGSFTPIFEAEERVRRAGRGGPAGRATGTRRCARDGGRARGDGRSRRWCSIDSARRDGSWP